MVGAASQGLEAPPDVSVIVPSFNNGHLLDRSVTSAFAAHGTRCEVIVVDDGSTDDTQQVLSRLGDRFPGLRSVRQANAGMSSARNAGLALARGRYIQYLDADDELLPVDLSGVFASGRDMVRLGVEEHTLGGQTITLVREEPDTTGPEFLNRSVAKGDFYTTCWAYVYRREWLQSTGVQFEVGIIHEDALFTVEVMAQARSFGFDPAVAYRYIRRPNSTTTTANDASKFLFRLQCLRIVTRKLVQLGNRRPDLDLRPWILHLTVYAIEIACRTSSRALRLLALRMHVDYLIHYRGKGAPALRYSDRAVLKKALSACLSTRIVIKELN